MPTKIFINYRRSDTKAEAQNLHKSLSEEFGKEAVFLDVHDIRAGSNWQEALSNSGSAAKVVLILISDQWLALNEKGQSRLFNQDDWVRREIELALEHNLVAIPVLFDQASMPSVNDLPVSLQPILQRNAISIRHESFPDDVRRLIREIRPHIDSKVQILFKENRKTIYVVGFLIAAILGCLIWNTVKTESAQCPLFDEDKEIKTLIFSKQKKLTPVVKHIDAEFQERCKSRFRNQNRPYHVSKALMSGGFHDAAKSCGADVFIVPKSQSISGLEVEFGYAHPELEQFYIDHNGKLDRRTDTINYGKGHSSFTGDLDEAICLITGFVMKQKGRLDNVAAELKKCSFSGSSWRTRVFAYNMMADSYIEQNKLDSAIVCLAYSDTVDWQIEDRMYKIAILAEQAEKPEIAIDYYSRLSALKTKNEIKYIENRGDQYRKIKAYKKAESDYEKVKTAKPNDTRINQKYKDLKDDIKVNDRFIGRNLHRNINAVTGVELADRLIQNGNTVEAEKVLSGLQRNPLVDKRAAALLLESQVRNGTINPTLIPQEMISNNPRLHELRKKID